MDNIKSMWEKIEKMAKFSDSYYDKSIQADMRKTLGIDEETKFEDLEKEGKTAQEVLSAFFAAMEPLSLMYEDILKLFVECEAKKSSNHIEIEFQRKGCNPVRFCTEHFLCARQIMRTLVQKQQQIILNPEGAKRLRRSSWTLEKIEEPKNQSYQNWKKEYYDENRGRFPEAHLDLEEKIRGLPIEENMRKAYRFWERLLSFYKSVKIDRAHWYECIGEKNYKERERELLYLETDFCLGGILKNLYVIAENYCHFTDKEKVETEKYLNQFMEVYQTAPRDIQKEVRCFQEFLRLPVWKKRYEVYSIWVFTQIMKAFPSECITYHIEKETLIFPFSGKCLASVQLGGKTFDIWTELRTETLVKPVGKGRKKAIQPDYSIVCGNGREIMDSIAVVECKQYKKAGVSNFSTAVIDYALNRPRAVVLLADYGEVTPERVRLKIEGTKIIPEERYELYSECRPHKNSARELIQKIRELVKESGTPGAGGLTA